MSKEPWVDQGVCIGCELCVKMVPSVFRMDEDGLAEVYDANGAFEGEILDAIDNCPVNCIRWR